MGSLSDQFYAMARELGGSVAVHQRAVTFVLGAGASLSSGAPTTPQVHAALEHATKMRLGQVRERLHEIVDEEVRDQLAPLFADVNPNLGYRLLAALGRDRRINVINLNWDDAIEQACSLAGVACEPCDPVAGDDVTLAEDKLPANRGVLVIHVHGTLRARPRYSLLETLPNQPPLAAAVFPLLNHTTIICGASLTGDLDVADALWRLERAQTSGPAFWMFARGDDPRIVDLPTRWTRVISPDVDFDALLTAIAEEVWGERDVPCARWSDVRRAWPHLRLPAVEQLVELDSSILRDVLDARVVALVSRPLVGKTVGALRLAHLRLLMEAPNATLHVSTDQADSVTGLGIAAHQNNVILMVDDPFGHNAPAQNPLVEDRLTEVARQDRSWVYVSSRDSNWTRYAGRMLRPLEGLSVPTRHAERWYEHRALLRLAGATGQPTRARRAVHAQRATTPPEVLEAAQRGRVLSSAERVDDARKLLDSDDALAAACVLVRMQELRAHPVPDAELAAIVERDLSDLPGVEALLYRYDMDGRSQWTFAHPTGRHVTDAYLLDRHDDVEHRLLSAPVVPTWIRRHLDGWRVQHGLLSPDHDRFGVEATAPGDWLTERLAAAPTEQLLRSVASLEFDQWETIELAYELVRLWESVQELHGAELLLRAILGKPMGAYALLEGCLYFQLGVEDELWTRVAGRLYELRRDPAATFERVLALDAVLWREPTEQVQRWAAQSFDDLDPRRPEFGFVRFASGYHPDGLVTIAPDRALERDRRLELTLEQARVAARMVAWHYGHQSRARALMHRYTHRDKQWLCQSFFEGEGRHPVAPTLALCEALLGFEETSGWAFHVLCNLAAVAGLDLQSDEVRGLAERALELAPAGDAGIVSAVLAYQTADVFRQEIRERVGRLDEEEHFLDALANGIDHADLHVGPPRFRYIYDAASVLRTLRAQFAGLPGELANQTPTSIAEHLWRAAPDVMGGATLPQRVEVARRVGRVERGDLRPVAVVARDGQGPDPYSSILRRWRETIPSGEQDRLFGG